MPKKQASWVKKWEFIIERLKKLISNYGKQIVVMNVEANMDVNQQFETYMKSVERFKKNIETVITTSLPGEERIFWPFKDVQFYIREGHDAIQSTGNAEMIQRVFNASDESVRSDSGPYFEFWQDPNIYFHIDTFQYADRERLFDVNYELDTAALVEKYQVQQSRELQDKDNWYLLKHFFIASESNNLEGFGDLIGGVPKDLKIKCHCGKHLDKRWTLKAFFKIPEYNFEFPYYLWISEPCEECHTTICIFRSKIIGTEGIFRPLRIFMNFLKSSWNFQLEDKPMMEGWRTILYMSMQKAPNVIKNIYQEDIIKFGKFFKKMDTSQ
ncbi:MAG: hypothetical protein EU531_05065 [Promethearchaeota archaeon]|nr:MAG: hypothetical protein EU531_05065 [Candidatus Lokiarchaeota archaeon]